MEMPKPVESDVVTGFVKRITKELEELPMHSHAAVVEQLRVQIQHRMANEQYKAQYQQMQNAEDRKRAAASVPALVHP